MRKLCIQKGVEIIEAEACSDHIHMLVSIAPYAPLCLLFCVILSIND